MASNRHGKVTRTVYVYDIQVWNAGGDRDTFSIKHRTYVDVESIKQDLIGIQGIVRAECSGIRRTIYGMDEREFYFRSHVLSSDPLDI